MRDSPRKSSHNLVSSVIRTQGQPNGGENKRVEQQSSEFWNNEEVSNKVNQWSKRTQREMKNIQREINVGPRVMQAIYYKYTRKKGDRCRCRREFTMGSALLQVRRGLKTRAKQGSAKTKGSI